MHQRLGDVLVSACQSGHTEAILVAPFIKRGALSRLLQALPDTLTLNCFTRWRPEEVAAGVSDLDVWLDINQRRHAQLWLCPSLHAKYFRVDEHCFVGSANITDAALGWSPAPNLEILHLIENGSDECRAFESKIMSSSIPCRQTFYEEMKALAALILVEKPIGLEVSSDAVSDLTGDELDVEGVNGLPLDLDRWLPSCRQPSNVYLAYSGHWDLLTIASRDACRRDLVALQIPSGLSKDVFVRYVGVQLFQMSAVSSVDQFVRHPQRFGAIRDFLRKLPCAQEPGFDSTYSWQTLMRWLLYFLSDRYEYSRPRHSEIFGVRRAQV